MALSFAEHPANVTRMILRTLLILTLLASCGRPLTEREAAFATAMHGTQIDTTRVRLVNGAPTASVTFRRQKRPRIACRERIFPEPTEQIVTTSPAAVALFNRVYFDKDWYIDNYMRDYPDRVNLVAAMLFAHEMTHIWQWQNRALTGYSPWRGAAEHRPGTDPYLFDPDQDITFLDMGYEQQAALVEEFICCRTLAPDAARTQRLYGVLAQVMPVQHPSQTPRPTEVLGVDPEADIVGVCD